MADFASFRSRTYPLSGRPTWRENAVLKVLADKVADTLGDLFHRHAFAPEQVLGNGHALGEQMLY